MHQHFRQRLLIWALKPVHIQRVLRAWTDAPFAGLARVRTCSYMVLDAPLALFTAMSRRVWPACIPRTRPRTVSRGCW